MTLVAAWCGLLSAATPQEIDNGNASPTLRRLRHVIRGNAMRIAEFESITPDLTNTELPCRLEQTGSSLRSAVVLTLFLPIAVLLLVTILTLVAQFIFDPATRSSFARQPAAALQVAFGISLIFLMISRPLRILVDRIGRRRIVDIDQDGVSVTDVGRFGHRSWQKPLTDYLGLTHHIRTTNAGARHELILVHSDRSANILLALSPRMTDKDVASLASRLNVAIVPPEALYGRTRLQVRPLFAVSRTRPLTTTEAQPCSQ